MMLFRKKPAVPRRQLVFAVGDIHGCLDLLLALRRRMDDYALALPDYDRTVVYLGDYIDRGPDSAGVIDFLCRGPHGDERQICLRGNHEQMLLDFLADPDIGPAWLDYINGGRASLQSYGVEEPASFAAMADTARALVEKLPPAHRDFLQNLPYWHEIGDYYFVHAGAHPNAALANQKPEDQLWIREPFLSSQHDFGKIIVHGHTIVAKPQLTPYRIGIDTGAYWGGTLSAIALHGTEQVVLQVR
jgi:serine/threonine protein phosphatase 1